MEAEQNNIVVCNNPICRKKYSVKFDKCPFCGAPKPNTKHKAILNEQVTCPKCGSKYRNTDNHCPVCGEHTQEWIEGEPIIPPLPISTTNNCYGRNYVELGVVTGCTVMSKHFIADALAGLKSIVGGEIKTYTKMLDDSRTEALMRMNQHAYELGADAVIGVRFSTSTIMPEAAEIMVYGTAIKFK